jgi:hypothetical protein
VTVGWAAAVVIAGLVAVLSAGLCFAALRRVEGRFALMEAALRDQVETLDDAVRMVEARVAESLSPTAGNATTLDQSSADEEAEFLRGESVDAAIAPEIQAAIAAAAVVVAGPNARVRSMQLSKAREDASAWSQQGRVLVQSSHNMRPSR